MRESPSVCRNVITRDSDWQWHGVFVFIYRLNSCCCTHTVAFESSLEDTVGYVNLKNGYMTSLHKHERLIKAGRSESSAAKAEARADENFVEKIFKQMGAGQKWVITLLIFI